MPRADSRKLRSIVLLLAVEVLAMSLWFVSAAVLPDMLREASVSPARMSAMSSAVQAGFVVGALLSAVLGIADRYDPRRVVAASAIAACFANAALLVAEPAGDLAIAVRFATGALLAGVYPVGMKIAVGWGRADRGFLVGALVGALTLGTAAPHLVSFAGGADWRLTVAAASLASLLAGLVSLNLALGPYHESARKFDAAVVVTAWTNRRVRLAYAGYLGHMWELYAMWAWIAAATAASYGVTLPEALATELSKLTAFTAIAAGGLVCAFAGALADRIGKPEVTILSMSLSGAAALATAATFGGPAWLTFTLVVIWGIAIIPDSAQFSALVSDAAPASQAGSLLTLQTALGFALTVVTVQAVPGLAEAFGWPAVLAGLAVGPALGILAMAKLRALG